MKHDCKKRNILYEIRCLTCEEQELEKIREFCGDDKNKIKEMEEKMSVPKYVGESGRSAYERGFEHLDQLASLSKRSIMLRHMIFKHEGEEFQNIKWGMFVVKFQRSSFERQINEAVTIDRESKTTEILNSKSEWNQSQLPRLVTRIGNPNEELKRLENEIAEEKKVEEELEKKLRTLRKEKNKKRLITEKGQPAKKRQKIQDSEYISIRETWGPPLPTAPKKTQKKRYRR